MISTSHIKTMARYNQWQNRSLYREAEAIGDIERRMPRGAFFSSIHGTLSHLIWGDMIWMHRFAQTPKPAGGITESPFLFTDWDTLAAQRVAFDDAIIAWSEQVNSEWLSGDMGWYSGAIGRQVTKPVWFLVTHMFNHQTHHRGQVHAMLTAAGAKPDDTDMIFMEAGS
jgi:uncharacterized damage-inducible protein DinB